MGEPAPPQPPAQIQVRVVQGVVENEEGNPGEEENYQYRKLEKENHQEGFSFSGD